MGMYLNDLFLQGFVNEDRFFDTVEQAIFAGLASDWLYSVRRATRAEDSLGIDGFAYIRNTRGEICRVPFQVKSSHHGIYRHYQDYQIFWMDRLPYFVINPDVRGSIIIQKFFDELRGIRLRNEVFRRVENHLTENGVACTEFIVKDPPQQPEAVSESLYQLSFHLAAE